MIIWKDYVQMCIRDRFLSGAFILGKKFAVTTIVSTFLYPLCLSVVQKIPGITTLTDNQLLSAIYAGVLMGIDVYKRQDMVSTLDEKMLSLNEAIQAYVEEQEELKGRKKSEVS